MLFYANDVGKRQLKPRVMILKFPYPSVPWGAG